MPEMGGVRVLHKLNNWLISKAVRNVIVLVEYRDEYVIE